MLMKVFSCKSQRRHERARNPNRNYVRAHISDKRAQRALVPVRRKCHRSIIHPAPFKIACLEHSRRRSTTYSAFSQPAGARLRLIPRLFVFQNYFRLCSVLHYVPFIVPFVCSEFRRSLSPSDNYFRPCFYRAIRVALKVESLKVRIRKTHALVRFNFSDWRGFSLIFVIVTDSMRPDTAPGHRYTFLCRKFV
jgi:hypothetical protein